jgi:uroporphyrinogen III methyltransferase / synthase
MSDSSKIGFVSLVGAGPGDPGLITVRGAECLAHADVVVYDRLANPLLLRLAPKAEWISVGKQPNRHPVPQEEINSLLIEKTADGKRVVRLKGGDPFVFGRGGEEALALSDAGIPFEIIPGITSAIAVPAYAGIPLTHRDVACSAAIITGHRAQWVENPELDWQKCSLAGDSLVFLMGVKNLPRLVEQLLAAGRSSDTPVALIERGTTANQKTVTGTLDDIVQRAAEIRPPAVIVVGEVVRLRDQLHWFDEIEHRPLFGLRVLNTKSVPRRSESRLVRVLPPLDEFDSQILALGGDAIHMPVIQIESCHNSEALQGAVRRLALEQAYDWVVFTSTNAVKALFEQLTTLRLDARALQGVQVGAVGDVTAQALQSQGIIPDFIPDRFTGADLAKQLPIQTGATVLLPRSEIALPELPEILKERGCVVDEVSAYTVKSTPPDKIVIEQLIAGQIDVVAFFSPSGVKGLADMLAAAGYTAEMAEVLSPVTVACIGQTTEQAAANYGLRVDVVAQEFTSSGLVKALEIWRKRL